MPSDRRRSGPAGRGQRRRQRERRPRTGGSGPSDGRVAPPSDFLETGDAYVIALDLPGFDRDRLDVQVEDHTLIVRAQRDAPDGSRQYHHRERALGRFERAFRLPDRVDLGGIEATLEDGVLEVRVPKSEPQQGRRIEISGS